MSISRPFLPIEQSHKGMPGRRKPESDNTLGPEIADLNPGFGTELPGQAMRCRCKKQMRARGNDEVRPAKLLRDRVRIPSQARSKGEIVPQPAKAALVARCLNKPEVDAADLLRATAARFTL